MAQSKLSEITNYPSDPVELFQLLLNQQPKDDIYMNLATVDDEFGCLNRTVIFRCLTDNCVTYVTQRHTRNYANLLKNPNVCITFLWPKLLIPGQYNNELHTWQVRLLGAKAIELPTERADELWERELTPAKIRAHVFPCGVPVDFAEQKAKHDNFLQEHLDKAIQRPSTYTAFKFIPERWDFLKVGVNEVADRLQYRRQENGEWIAMHVAT